MKIRLFIVAVASIAIAVVMAILLGMPEAQAQTICGPVQAAVIPGDVVHLKIEYCYSGDFHNFENSGLLPPHDGHSEGNSSSDRCWQYYVAATAPDYNTNWHIDLTGGSFSGWNCNMEITSVDRLGGGRRFVLITDPDKAVYGGIARLLDLAGFLGTNGGTAFALTGHPGIGAGLTIVGYNAALLSPHFYKLQTDPPVECPGVCQQMAGVGYNQQMVNDLNNAYCADDDGDGGIPWVCDGLKWAFLEAQQWLQFANDSLDRAQSCIDANVGCENDRRGELIYGLNVAGDRLAVFAYYVRELQTRLPPSNDYDPTTGWDYYNGLGIIAANIDQAVDTLRNAN